MNKKSPARPGFFLFRTRKFQKTSESFYKMKIEKNRK